MNWAFLFILALLLHFIANQVVSGHSAGKVWYNWLEDNPNEDERQIADGILPVLSCPFGTYRKFKGPSHEPGGINLDGCMKCPKGVYGNSTDLYSPNCTAPCPKGTYGNREGATSIEDCEPCPIGTFGEEEGLINSQCSGKCNDLNYKDNQYYSAQPGLTTRGECILCNPFYDYRTCKWNYTRDEDFVEHYSPWMGYIEEILDYRYYQEFMLEWMKTEELIDAV